MKRYRYPSSQKTFIGKYGPYLYFFAAWNAAGYMLYRLSSKKVRETTPDFDNMNYQQKALIMFGYGKENVNVHKVTIEGLKVTKREDMSAKECVDSLGTKKMEEVDKVSMS